ncbi:MAG: hypothetical protein ACREHC_01665 [Candidatus Levyibacteriota bacterium]
MRERVIRGGPARRYHETKNPNEGSHLSGKVSLLLTDLRSRYETAHKPADIYDLAKLFEAERDDHKIKFTSRRQSGNPWNSLIRSVSDLQAGQAIASGDKEAIATYLSARIDNSEAKTRDKTLSTNDRTKADAEQKTYLQLRNAFYGATNSPEKILDADKLMTKADSEARMKDILPSAEEFAQYDINLENTNKVLDEMGRTKQFTYDQMSQFLNALTTDVQREEQKYENNPKWRAKKAIVRSAEAFYKEHAKDQKAGLIYVTVNTDGSNPQAGWKPAGTDEKGVNEYIFDPYGKFDPGGEWNDPKSLDYHLYNLDQFPKLLHDVIPGAQRTVEKVKAGKKFDPQEAIYLRILIERFAGVVEKESPKQSSEKVLVNF